MHFFCSVIILVAAAHVKADNSGFCRRDGWRENFVDDYKLAYKALTGSPDWVNRPIVINLKI